MPRERTVKIVKVGAVRRRLAAWATSRHILGPSSANADYTDFTAERGNRRFRRFRRYPGNRRYKRQTADSPMDKSVRLTDAPAQPGA